MAGDCELVLVVGSPNSSNSRRLVEIAVQAGAGAAHLIDNAGEIDPRWLDGVGTVGVTSGASVPELLVAAVLDELAAHGWRDIENVVTAEETFRFAPPRVQRRAEETRWAPPA
jgi:4-hydroxy-3-methylbut-2-enyl diphosphate reductase